MTVRIRRARQSDGSRLSALRAALWPEGTRREHGAELEAILAGRPTSTLPFTIFVAEAAGRIVGFLEVGLRSHADGCDPRRAVGFVEGWYVVPKARRKGVARALLIAAEAWSREQGCREMASDTWIDDRVSRSVHRALGFEVVDRCVHFRKALGRKPPARRRRT